MRGAAVLAPTGDRFSLVALNFTDGELVVPFRFPVGGDYFELLEGNPVDGLSGVSADGDVQLHIPSNYGGSGAGGP